MLKATEPAETETLMNKLMASTAAKLRAGNISPREAIKLLGDAIEESFGPMDPLEVLRIAAEEVKENVLPDIFNKDGSVNETALDERNRRIKSRRDNVTPLK